MTKTKLKEFSPWFSRIFTEKIYNPCPTTIPKPLKLYSYILPKIMTDQEIMETTKSDPLSISEFMSTLIHLIETDGLSKKTFNIFHVKLNDDSVLAVYTFWRSGDCKWCCDGRELDGWYAEGQFLSRNNPETLSTSDPLALGTLDTLPLDTVINNAIKTLKDNGFTITKEY